MDALIYLKDTVMQPDGKAGEVLKNNIFDFQPVTEEKVIIHQPETIFDTANNCTYKDEVIYIHDKAEYERLIERINLGEGFTYEVKEVSVVGSKLITDYEELKQACLFAALKQYGSDPLAPTEGVRWAEAYMGEIPQELLMLDIQNAVKSVSSIVTPEFTTVKDAEGNEYFSFTLKIMKGENDGN